MRVAALCAGSEHEADAKGAVRLHTVGVGDHIGSAAVGDLADRVAEVVFVVEEVKISRPRLRRSREPFRHNVDGDDPTSLSRCGSQTPRLRAGHRR
jgi:hypothetical protein